VQKYFVIFVGGINAGIALYLAAALVYTSLGVTFNGATHLLYNSVRRPQTMTMTATAMKRKKKLTPNVQLSSFNVVG